MELRTNYRFIWDGLNLYGAKCYRGDFTAGQLQFRHEYWLARSRDLGITNLFIQAERCADVEQAQALWSMIAICLMQGYAPSPAINMTLPTPTAVWRVKSSLQKAVRRSQVEHGLRATHALLVSDPQRFWRRLVIILMEDIGVADLSLVAMGLTLAGSKKLRDQIGGKKVAFWLVEEMCKTVKSRDCNEITGYVDYATDRKAMLRAFDPFKNDAEKLTAVALDQDAPMCIRVAACHMLAGTLRFRLEGKLPATAFDKIAWWQLLKEMKLPPIVEFVTRIAEKRGCERLHLGLPFVWEILTKSRFIGVKINELPEQKTVAGLMTEAFDQHTRDGKRAMAYFSQVCKPVQQFFKDRPNVNKVGVLGVVVFQVEGAVLQRRLDYSDFDEISTELSNEEIRSTGLPLNEVKELCELVEGNLDMLHHSRMLTQAKHMAKINDSCRDSQLL